MPLASINAAPLDAPMVFPPVLAAAERLPDDVRRATGFDHVGVNWEAHGHPPALFVAPHFDFHFYTASPPEIAAVDCTNAAKPASLPHGYALPDVDIPGMGVLVGLCVPAMGMHAMPVRNMAGVENRIALITGAGRAIGRAVVMPSSSLGFASARSSPSRASRQTDDYFTNVLTSKRYDDPCTLQARERPSTSTLTSTRPVERRILPWLLRPEGENRRHVHRPRCRDGGRNDGDQRKAE